MKKIELATVDIGSLSPAPWRATHVLKPDLKLLTESIREYGVLSPLVVRKESMTIIDGFHRYVSLQNDKSLLKSSGGKILAQVVDCSEIEAMVMHIRLNRGRGNVVSHHMSRLLKKINQSGAYGIHELQSILGMNVMEIDMMLDGSLIKMRKVSEHTYSKAWVPVEAPSGKVENIVLERPPNPDR
jgi:ParB-like chromosome segregation protein Spo0J